MRFVLICMHPILSLYLSLLIFTLPPYSPMIDNLMVYLDSITRLEAIHHDLTHSELAHCKISLERITAAISDARSKVEAAFRSWLTEAKLGFIGCTVADSGSNESIPESSQGAPETLDTIAQALQIIVNFSLNSPAHFSALIADWIEIRSNYLAGSCETLFVQAQSFEKADGKWIEGSHPLPRAFQHARSLLQAEELFMSKVWPTTAIGPTFLRSAQIVRDLAVSTVEGITGKMKKALSRREYVDQVYLFNVLGHSYTSVHVETTNESSLAVQVLLPSLKFFVTTTATLLTDLIGEIRGTIPRAIERPFTIPQNATVYELTSLTVNVLKRIEKDSRVIDAILVGQSSNNWDGTLNTLADPPSLTHVQRYFSDILGSLESSIDAKSKTLRRPMQTLLFQLNNYNYLAKGVRAISNELVDAAVVGKRYEQIIEALKRSFINRYIVE